MKSRDKAVKTTISTKNEKYELDDFKRRESLKLKVKLNQNRQRLIRNALSDTSSKETPNKKIVFDDIDEGEEPEIPEPDPKEKSKDSKSMLLFNDSDVEDEISDFKIQSQFEGKKGKKLLDLQSRYQGDERFKIDERFKENDNEDVNGTQNEDNLDDEKKRQLEILQEVLGHPIKVSTSKKEESSLSMQRFDPSNAEHSKYLVQKDDKEESNLKKKLKKSPKNYEKKKEVSKEKFYSVSENIKETFKVKENGAASFSLLSAYGKMEVDNKSEDEQDEEEEEELNIPTMKTPPKNSLKPQSEEKTVCGVRKERFFFTDDDPRIKEGLEFINKKNSTEALGAAEELRSKRRGLRYVLKRTYKKQLQKKNPFKKKVGGSNSGFNDRRNFKRRR